METLPQKWRRNEKSGWQQYTGKVKQENQTSFLPLTRSFFACEELRRPDSPTTPLLPCRRPTPPGPATAALPPGTNAIPPGPTTPLLPYRRPTPPGPATAALPPGTNAIPPGPTTPLLPYRNQSNQIGRSAKLPLTHHGASVLFGVPLVLLKQRSIRSISVEASQCDNRKGASMLSWQQIYHRRCLLRLRNSRHKDLQSVRVRRGCRMRFEVKRIV
jgi:hypothetical protein